MNGNDSSSHPGKHLKTAPVDNGLIANSGKNTAEWWM
jgi:hypothetical protein